jgi:hypothetical protein
MANPARLARDSDFLHMNQSYTQKQSPKGRFDRHCDIRMKQMKRPQWIHAIYTLVVSTAMVAGGCRTTQVEQYSYNYRILSEPEGAEVLDDGGRRMGTTPMNVENHYEIKREEVPTSLSVGATFGGIAVMGLGIGLTVSTIDSEERNLGLLMGSAFTIFAGMASAALGATAWTGFFDGSSYRIAGAQAWNAHSGFEHPSSQQVDDWLFPSPQVVKAPGYKEQPISPQGGEVLLVEMAPTESNDTGRVTTRSISDSEPKQRRAERPAPEPAPSPEDVSEDFLTASPQPSAFALVVGVGDYRDIPDPAGARADAERFAQMLETSMGLPAKNILLLTDAHATRSDVLGHATWLKSNVPEGSRIYFYFSGHGTPDVKTGQSYILPHEATPEMLADTGIKLSAVLQRLGDSQAKEVLAFVDSCFSGSGGRSVLPKGTRPLVPIKEMAKQSRVALFSAAGASQISGNLPDEDAGLFTHHVLEGVGKGRADADGNGQVTLAELRNFVQPRVARIAKESSRDQTPQMTVADELGDSDKVVVTWGLPLR